MQNWSWRIIERNARAKYKGTFLWLQMVWSIVLFYSYVRLSNVWLLLALFAVFLCSMVLFNYENESS